jgi:DNA-binding transcriptional regulator YhcF (GntR family)
MEFRENPAIYIQIADWVCEQILLNKWKIGEKIISIRDLAVDLEVNPNTVQRAYDFLQQREIINNRRGIGYFVDENAMDLILDFRHDQFMENELPLLMKNMYLLKIDPKEIKTRFEEYIKKHFKK